MRTWLSFRSGGSPTGYAEKLFDELHVETSVVRKGVERATLRCRSSTPAGKRHVLDLDVVHRIDRGYDKQSRPNASQSVRLLLEPGKLGKSTPFRLYVVATLISASSSSVSNFVRHRAVNPLIIVVYRRRTRSSQPHRRFRPVVTPHSRPRVCKCSPIS